MGTIPLDVPRVCDGGYFPSLLKPQRRAGRIPGTNSLERLNKEINRRTAVVEIFLNRVSVTRLVRMLLAEQDDEGQDGQCYSRVELTVLIEALAQIEEVGQPLLLAS